jgi:hypothetical protein
MGLRFRVVLLMAMAVCGGLMATVASAASTSKTSVSLQFVSHTSYKGRVSSPNAGCVRSRVIHLQVREGRKWVSVATVKSNHSGRFHGTLHHAGGRYRAVAGGTGSCAPGSSKAVTLPTGTTGGSGQSGASGLKQPACSLPLTHDTYDGFHIAVPSGWELFTLKGQIEVEKDAVGSEAVVVVPAAQTSGLTPASYFQSELSNFESLAAASGTPITVTGSSSPNGIPSSTFTATIAGQPASGQATVLVEPLAGQVSSTELVFVADWAPQAAFGTESSRLSSIGDCYGPEQGSLYRMVQDPAFTYMLPPGWSIPQGGEGQDSLLLSDPQGDTVAYLLGGEGPNFQFDSPQTEIDSYLAYVGIDSVTSLWSVTPPGANGAPGNLEYEEFTATYQGNPVHGLIYSNVSINGVFNTGVIRIALAPAGSWNAVNGALIQMMGAIQHNFTQDLETINQLNQQWQSFNNQVANFDDTLNNQQLTQDPTTGIYYDAPYDSYESDGPNGPGYYNGDQRLNIINRQ